MAHLRMAARLTAMVLACTVAGTTAALAQMTGTAGETLAPFYRRLAEALKSGRPAAYLDLLSPSYAARPETQEFVRTQIVSGVTNVVINEAGKLQLKSAPRGAGYGILLEVFTEQRRVGEVATWLLNVRNDIDPVTNEPFEEAPEWRIIGEEQLTSTGGLYSLWLHPERQYVVRDLTIEETDFTLSLPEGMAFVADTGFGVTALVLEGKGEMIFQPTPAVEREQLVLFAGAEILRTSFKSAFLRINPDDFDALVSQDALIERTVGPRDFAVAGKVFDKYAPESYAVDLGELSDDRWWVLPNSGDLLAEVQTRRFGNLTYVKAGNKAEDVQLFERSGNRNISVYASAEKLLTRGRFYSEDDLVDYDVQRTELDVAFVPKRDRIEGRATLTIKAVADLTMLVIRLADALAVRSVSSDRFGKLLPLRTPGQNTMILNLPSTARKGMVFTLTVEYDGKLPAERPDHQAIVTRSASLLNPTTIVHPTFRTEPEPHYLYSSQSLWYPQSTVTDYATARLRLTVPPNFECVASGELDGPPTELREGEAGLPAGSTRYVFAASRPVRYLAAVVSEFSAAGTRQISLREARLAAGPGGGNRTLEGTGQEDDGLALSVETNFRQRRRARHLSATAEDIVRFYTSIVGDVPFPSLTIALVENELPGGQSPAYLSLLSEPRERSDRLWRRDPVYFRDFPDFFLAHELAHQWWGQAIGWSNYHEQWLSEGLAQYFGALYAQHARGNRLFRKIIRQMRTWAMDKSDQGPVYLGYRLGHIKQDTRIFRALVYDKGALVLHMLRRLVGDEAFFRGVRRYYYDFRYRKTGTEDLRRAFEQESDIPLSRFFERWIHEDGLPRLAFSYTSEPHRQSTDDTDERAADSDVVLRFEQLTDDLYDVPVTVTLKYNSGDTRDVIVNVTDRVTQIRVPLDRVLRGVDVNRDYAALAKISRR